MTEFISWLCVLEYDMLLLSSVIIGAMFVAITGTNGKCNSMSGKIDTMFLFIIIPVIDTLVSYIISISSCICPVKQVVVMRKCNIDDIAGNKIDTYSNSRTSSDFYTNDNNNTICKFTRSVPSTLLCVGIILVLNMENHYYWHMINKYFQSNNIRI